MVLNGTNSMQAGNTVTVSGTTNYNGTWTLVAATASRITLPVTYTAETPTDSSIVTLTASTTKAEVIKPNEAATLWWPWSIDIGAHRTVVDTVTDTDRIAMNKGDGSDATYTTPAKLWEYMEPKVEDKVGTQLHFLNVSDSPIQIFSSISLSTDSAQSGDEYIFADMPTLLNKTPTQLVLQIRAVDYGEIPSRFFMRVAYNGYGVGISIWDPSPQAAFLCMQGAGDTRISLTTFTVPTLATTATTSVRIDAASNYAGTDALTVNIIGIYYQE